ncbi:MAG: GNAT family N-acetyltransferase, partial [Chitinimonas sp.]|nr:GNAT family N-acetyltransferase [Chitinimonas sp.]
SVRERASGEIVGQAGLINPAGYPAMEIGWLIHREYWGRGYASEAGQAALSYALEVVQAARVEAHIEPANLASLAVARKLGMAVDGLASSQTMTILEKTRSAA